MGHVMMQILSVDIHVIAVETRVNMSAGNGGSIFARTWLARGFSVGPLNRKFVIRLNIV